MTAATRLEKFYWWCDRWLCWTVNGWFAWKACQLMLKRTQTIHDPSFVKSTRVE
jgi:hypothetical protein